MEMTQYQSKGKTIGAISALLFAGSELSAANISWGLSSATAVPMSSTSMAIMAALFMIGGIWILSKTEKKAQSFLVLALLMAGAYNVNVIATDIAPINISGPSGNADIYFGARNIVTNNNEEPIRITNIDTEGCPAAPSELPCNEGGVVNPNQSCEIDLRLCGPL